ncbi:MAG: GNAT family N-acetyltransferase [Sandaracinaceae bacterium]|nr:GNAT family N-acetyltransferase [Sandaracinaceae bacterium]
MTDDIRIVTRDEDVRACHAVMVHLRPHVGPDAFVERVRAQAAQGYRLAALYDGGVPVAVAGYRMLDNLAWGRAMYVDDLVADASARSRGHGGRLFDWLVAHARAEGAAELHLDSGVQRFDAHRFYLAKRMAITSHHFAMKL